MARELECTFRVDKARHSTIKPRVLHHEYAMFTTALLRDFRMLANVMNLSVSHRAT